MLKNNEPISGSGARQKDDQRTHQESPMSQDTPTFDPDVLLQELDWIRRVAFQLVREETRAEDLTQETLLKALSNKPHQGEGLRPWLRTVMRNLFLMELRKEKRHVAKLAEIAKTVDVEGTFESVERASAHRDVVDRLMDLREPYRTTLILRYWEDLQPREVAERMGVPVETVRTRTKRGLAQLRGRMDKEWGSLGAWAGPILGIPDWGKRASVGVSGVVAASGLLFVMLMSAWTLWGTSARGASGVPAHEGAERIKDASTIQAGGDQDQSQRAGGNLAAGRRIEVRPPDAPRAVSGSIVDPTTGSPLSGVKIQFKIKADGASSYDLLEKLETDGTGKFSVMLPDHLTGGLLFGASHSGRVRLQRLWKVSKEDLPGDLGVIRMPVGCRAHVSFIGDSSRSRRPGFVVTERQGGPDLKFPFVATNFEGLLGKDGSLAPEQILPGTYSISYLQGFDGQVESPTFVIPDGEREVHIKVKVLQKKQDWDGRILDVNGKPSTCEGLTCISAFNGRRFECVLGATGQFRVKWQGDGRAKMRVRFRASLDNPALGGPERYDWPETQIVHGAQVLLRLPRLRRVSISVKDAETGRPIEGFGIRWVVGSLAKGSIESSVKLDRLRYMGLHAQGRIELKQFRVGRFLLQVHPKTMAYEPSPIREVIVRSNGPVAVEVRLKSRKAQRLHLVDHVGDPIHGCKVVLYQRLWTGPFLQNHSEFKRNDRLRRYPRLTQLLKVEETTTDAMGSCNLRGIPGKEYVLMMTSPDIRQIRDSFRIQFGGKPMEVRLDAQCGVRIKISDKGLDLPKGVAVRLFVAEGDRFLPTGLIERVGSRPLSLDRLDSGRVQPVLAGEVRIVLSMQAKSPVSVPWRSDRVVVGPRTLAVGDVVDVDLGALIPTLGSTSLDLKLASGSVKGGRLYVWSRETRTSRKWRGPVLVCRHEIGSQARVRLLLPLGEYDGRIEIGDHWGESAQLLHSWSMHPLQIGSRTVDEPPPWTFKTEDFHLRFEGAMSGKALPGLRFTLSDRGQLYFWRSIGREHSITDKFGHAELRGLPPIPLELSIRDSSAAPGKEMNLGVVRLQAGETTRILVPGR